PEPMTPLLALPARRVPLLRFRPPLNVLPELVNTTVPGPELPNEPLPLILPLNVKTAAAVSTWTLPPPPVAATNGISLALEAPVYSKVPTLAPAAPSAMLD